MRNLDASAWLKNPTLEVIEADKNDRIAKFKLRLQQESLIPEPEVKPAKGAKGRPAPRNPMPRPKQKPKPKVIDQE
jgi:Tfp pilus assembly protein PilN